VGERRILRVEGERLSVSREARFESEAELERAISSHPEVLPSEDLGLGPLVCLANQLDFGSGPLDLLAVDGQGRLVVVEFKRGTENPDVRKVVAQVLDYGASLWQTTFDELEDRCSRAEPGLTGSLQEHVSTSLAALDIGEFDADAFRRGVETCLENGDFVFLYVGRDLDSRTRRIMTYLAEGPRMTFFAVEVDCYRDGTNQSAVLVPRTAFLPSWVSTHGRTGHGTLTNAQQLAQATPETQAFVHQMDEFAKEFGLITSDTKTGRAYRPRPGRSGIGVYFASGRGVEFNLKSFRTRDQEDFADAFLEKLRNFSGTAISAKDWPAIPIERLARDWTATRRELIAPYFEARLAHYDIEDTS
jgi:hypothetical protein